MEGKPAVVPFDGDVGTAPEGPCCPWPAVVRGRGEGTKGEDLCSGLKGWALWNSLGC